MRSTIRSGELFDGSLSKEEIAERFGVMIANTATRFLVHVSDSEAFARWLDWLEAQAADLEDSVGAAPPVTSSAKSSVCLMCAARKVPEWMQVPLFYARLETSPWLPSNIELVRDGRAAKYAFESVGKS